MADQRDGGDYREAGVRTAEEMPAFEGALSILRRTFAFPTAGRPALDFGYYATVLDLGNNQGLAFSTDGVGTKLLIASELGKFDTVGIDCVAMNANDIVCVGARPISMVDYVAVESAGGDELRQIAVGLHEGARQAGISIPGGETAQVPAMLHRVPGQWAFDLVGTCVGLVPLDRVIVGQHVEPGDALVGFGSSGIHSNGLTLARGVFLERAGWALARQVPECGRTLGEELLAPTTMYVNLALSLMERLPVKALAHITGDGLLNLRRIQAACGFDIEYLPPPHPVFTLIRQLGEIDLSEMYQVFNMGIGFCVVVPAGVADAAIAIGRDHGLAAWRLGGAVASEERRVRLLPIRVESAGGHFTPARR